MGSAVTKSDRRYRPRAQCPHTPSGPAAAHAAMVSAAVKRSPAARAAVAAKSQHQDDEEAPVYTLLTTYISYIIVIVFGYMRDFFGKRLKPSEYSCYMETDVRAALRRRVFFSADSPEKPESGGKEKFTGHTRKLLNLSSYNYLGFANNDGPCADAVEATIKKYGISTVAPRFEAGTSELHSEVEAQVARFVGTEAAIVVSM
ncbi:MAG: hypothetical protein BJ554DRAFT_472, partial [Olpidium bornovanus]